MYLLTDIQYFPSIILFKSLYKNSYITFDVYETYQKMSFRNRSLISGANGVIPLSIPLVGGRGQKGLTKEVRIDYRSKWQLSHFRSISSSYNKSPWFEFYRDGLEDLYRKQFDFLVDWDLACFEWVVQQLGLEIQVSLSDHYVTKPEEGTTDFRGRLMPKNYLDFEPVVYHQVFESRLGFVPNLSILDLLFCEGKRALELWGK
jgi:hypothetical protein